MRSEGLIEAQRKAAIAASELNLKVDMTIEAQMQPDTAKRLKTMHSRYWHDSAAGLPDGWAGILGDFLASLDDIGDLVEAVSVRFERCPDGLRAFVFPEMSRWHPEQMNALRIAQRNLLHASRETCEWCGKAGAEPCTLGERVSFFLCSEDKQRAEEKLATQIEAFDARVRFREQVKGLFQEHANIWLHVSDHNTPILRAALLDVKKIVEDRDLIGKIHVTKITESEGQLFLSVRYDPAVDMATRVDVDDVIHHAQWLSDEASLKADRGGSDDA